MYTCAGLAECAAKLVSTKFTFTRRHLIAVMAKAIVDVDWVRALRIGIGMAFDQFAARDIVALRNRRRYAVAPYLRRRQASAARVLAWRNRRASNIVCRVWSPPFDDLGAYSSALVLGDIFDRVCKDSVTVWAVTGSKLGTLRAPERIAKLRRPERIAEQSATGCIV